MVGQLCCGFAVDGHDSWKDHCYGLRASRPKRGQGVMIYPLLRYRDFR